MKYLGITKGDEGKFITRYDIHYQTEDGQDKKKMDRIRIMRS